MTTTIKIKKIGQAIGSLGWLAQQDIQIEIGNKGTKRTAWIKIGEMKEIAGMIGCTWDNEMAQPYEESKDGSVSKSFLLDGRDDYTFASITLTKACEKIVRAIKNEACKLLEEDFNKDSNDTFKFDVREINESDK